MVDGERLAQPFLVDIIQTTRKVIRDQANAGSDDPQVGKPGLAMRRCGRVGQECQVLTDFGEIKRDLGWRQCR